MTRLHVHVAHSLPTAACREFSLSNGVEYSITTNDGQTRVMTYHSRNGWLATTDKRAVAVIKAVRDWDFALDLARLDTEQASDDRLHRLLGDEARKRETANAQNDMATYAVADERIHLYQAEIARREETPASIKPSDPMRPENDWPVERVTASPVTVTAGVCDAGMPDTVTITIGKDEATALFNSTVCDGLRHDQEGRKHTAAAVYDLAAKVASQAGIDGGQFWADTAQTIRKRSRDAIAAENRIAAVEDNRLAMAEMTASERREYRDRKPTDDRAFMRQRNAESRAYFARQSAETLASDLRFYRARVTFHLSLGEFPAFYFLRVAMVRAEQKRREDVNGDARVAKALVTHLLANGCHVTVWNGGAEPEIRRSTVRRSILAAMGQSDEDTLVARRSDGLRAKFYLVYGNAADGSELISDHTDNPFADAVYKAVQTACGFA